MLTYLQVGNVGQTNYGASKAGVIGFTKSAAKEVAKFNIRVNAILPGFIKTPMTEKVPEHLMQITQMLIPMTKLGEPEDIADACVFLASDKSRYITGATLEVSGGLFINRLSGLKLKSVKLMSPDWPEADPGIELEAYFGKVAKKNKNLDERVSDMNGIQGMGKTTSLIYFVLQCLMRNIKSTHYIDHEVVKDDKDITKSLTDYDASNLKGCLIIDHYTQDNFMLMNETKKVFIKKSKIILVETDFAASFHACTLEMGKDMQLNEEDFSSIWNVSLNLAYNETTESLIGKGRGGVFIYQKMIHHQGY
ncbi:HSD17B8 [Mytilus edulis]|uniref:HSD17B8 n=1 Tax=Mytilus edulis TaxID=6550 RepID=A0A8S3TX51_MYTED|nr:HSD17B8 [Mytilus edulis]